MTSITVELPDELARAVSRQAKQRGLTLDEVIAESLARYRPDDERGIITPLPFEHLAEVAEFSADDVDQLLEETGFFERTGDH